MKWTPPHFISCPFTPTCNAHDACYGTCFSGKGNCDYAFYEGLLGHCYGCYTANFWWWDPGGWIWLGDCSAVALMHWSRRGLKRLLSIRTALCSDRYEAFWNWRAAKLKTAA